MKNEVTIVESAVGCEDVDRVIECVAHLNHTKREAGDAMQLSIADEGTLKVRMFTSLS